MLPVLEIFTLFEVFVKPVQLVLLVLTAMICVVSGVSILVSIYNSMAGRRHEIAVMRALGASRAAVLSIVLVESIMLSVGGGAVGWMLGPRAQLAGQPDHRAAHGRVGRVPGFRAERQPLRTARRHAATSSGCRFRRRSC